MAKGSSGLDELFDRVFNEKDLKETVDSMHHKFGPAEKGSPVDEEPPVEVKTAKTAKQKKAADPAREHKEAPGVTAYTAQHEPLESVGEKPSDETSDGRSDVPSVDRTDVSSQGQTLRLMKPHTIRQTGENLGRASTPHTHHDTAHQTARQTDQSGQFGQGYLDPIMELTVRQGMVLYHLINTPGYISQRQKIFMATGIPLPTQRDIFTALTKYGFITKPRKYNWQSFQGFTYTINPDLCQRFMALRGEEFRSMTENYQRQTLPQTPRLNIYTSDVPLGDSSDVSLPRSSSLKTFPTSSENPVVEIAALLENDPELEFWKDRNLSVQQIQNWMVTAGGCSVEAIMQSLKHFAFEMTEPGKAEKIPEPEGYFFSVLKRSGTYRKPTKYKSRAELLVEIAEQKLADDAVLSKRLAEALRKREEQEEELEFQKMMADEKGEMYQTCFKELDTLAKTQRKGVYFQNAMRAKFRVIAGYAAPDETKDQK